MSTDRRAFLRRAALLGCALPLGSVAGCRLDETASPRGGGTRASHPVLVPWSDDAVHLLAPPPQAPLAYLSRREQRVYVDPGHRDTVQRLLRAYISVSTDLWRIPMPGDDPRVPIPPDNEAREFEAWDLWHWSPGATPALGDVRIVAAAAVSSSIQVTCAPVLASEGEWISTAPFAVTRLAGGPDDPSTETFGKVAAGVRYPDRECTGKGVPVRVLSWAG